MVRPSPMVLVTVMGSMGVWVVSLLIAVVWPCRSIRGTVSSAVSLGMGEPDKS